MMKKEMKRIGKWQRIAAIAVIAIVMAFILEILQITTQPQKVVCSEETEEQETTIYPDWKDGMTGYEEAEGGLNVTAGDPQLYFSTAATGKISKISFRFYSPLKESIRIQVFYPGKNGKYSEKNSVITECPEGTESWSVEIPGKQYGKLRIDMDGTFIPLATITATNTVPVRIPQPAKMHPLRILIAAVILFAVILWMRWVRAWESIRGTFRSGIRGIREGGKKSLLYAAAFPVIIGITVVVFWVICSKINGRQMAAPRIVFAAVLGAFIACLLVFRKTARTQPEYLFLVLVLCVGFLYSFYLPHTGKAGWDEGDHFEQALASSYVDSTMITQQDEITISSKAPQSYDLGGGVQRIRENQDRLYRAGAVEEPETVAVESIPEAFNGLGLFLGRVLGLRYYMIHFMGRFFGLMTYAFAGFLAIRKLKSGKMIAATVLLIPTEVFIAGCYQNEAYLTAFTALGLCYYIAQWQDPKAGITLKDAIIMIGSITFGCLAGPACIPLLWILIFLPKEKFAGRKHHCYYVLSMAAATGVIMGISIVRGPAMSGGSEMNAGSQLDYILHHTGAYFSVMRQQSLEFFNPNQPGKLFTNTAHMGTMPNQYLYLMLTAAVAFTDKSRYDEGMLHRPLAHIGPVILSFIAIGWIITDRYLLNTPVGAEQVSGVQIRALIPLLLPVLMHIGFAKIRNETNRGWYNSLVIVAAAYVEFACVYTAVITKYYF